MIEYYQNLIDENRALHGSDIMIPNDDLEILLKIARCAEAYMRRLVDDPCSAWPIEFVALREALSALPPVEDKEPGK